MHEENPKKEETDEKRERQQWLKNCNEDWNIAPMTNRCFSAFNPFFVFFLALRALPAISFGEYLRESVCSSTTTCQVEPARERAGRDQEKCGRYKWHLSTAIRLRGRLSFQSREMCRLNYDLCEFQDVEHRSTAHLRMHRRNGYQPTCTVQIAFRIECQAENLFLTAQMYGWNWNTFIYFLAQGLCAEKEIKNLLDFALLPFRPTSINCTLCVCLCKLLARNKKNENEIIKWKHTRVVGSNIVCWHSPMWLELAETLAPTANGTKRETNGVERISISLRFSAGRGKKKTR